MRFSASLEVGIRLTQVGDPLAHGQERYLHCASSDRLPGGPRARESSAEAE